MKQFIQRVDKCRVYEFRTDGMVRSVNTSLQRGKQENNAVTFQQLDRARSCGVSPITGLNICVKDFFITQLFSTGRLSHTGISLNVQSSWTESWLVGASDNESD